MATKPKSRGLGRGLDALLAGNNEPERSRLGEPTTTLAVAQLQPGKYQPRTRMDPASLAELAESIKAQGIIQPILVRAIGEGEGGARYEILAGERRFRAAQLAGLTDVPVVLRDVPDESALAIALIENIQREDLNAIEEAHGIKRLVDEFGMTHEKAAQAVGRSRSAASNMLRLLQLPPLIQDMLHNNELDMGHARALLPLDPARQLQAAQEIKSRSLSVRAAETLVNAYLSGKPPAAGAGGKKGGKKGERTSKDTLRLQEELSEKLGTTVTIHPQRKGGKLIIEYASNEHLDDLLGRIH